MQKKIIERPKTVKTEALYGPIRPYKARWRGRSAPLDDDRIGLKDVRLSNSGLLGRVSVLKQVLGEVFQYSKSKFLLGLYS